MPSAPLIDRIDAALPQTQCTRCGYPTCRAYAEAIRGDVADINQCSPGGADGVAALAQLLGRNPKPLNPANGLEGVPVVAFIDEDVCIGCTKCIQACPVDAIVGTAKRMHTIIVAECTGCGLCLPPCPVDCIALLPTAVQPLARTQVLERAVRARARFDAREARLEPSPSRGEPGFRAALPRAGERLHMEVQTGLLRAGRPGLGGDGVAPDAAPIAAEAAPAENNECDARPISRSAVLEAIARGKARRQASAKDPSPR